MGDKNGNRALSTRKTEGLPRNRVQDFGAFRLTPQKGLLPGKYACMFFILKDQAVCALNADPVCPRPRISEPFQAPSLEADARTRARAGHKGQGQRQGQGQGPRAAARCDGGHAGTPNMSNSNQIKS